MYKKINITGVLLFCLWVLGVSGDCLNYRTVIEVKQSDSNGCTRITNSTSSVMWICPTLTEAILELKLWNDTCIRILDKASELTDSISIAFAFNFKITSSLSLSKLKCSDENAGLSFFNGNNVIVENIKFINCGRIQDMIRRVKTPSVKEKVHVTTTLFFEKVENVTIEQCCFFDHRGYGIILTDCSGQIKLNWIDMNGNRPVKIFSGSNNSLSDHMFGGGILFQHILEETISGTNLLLSNSEFEYLKGFNATSDPVLDYSEKTKPFGLGGSICIYLLYSRSTTVRFSNLLIHLSYALYGGGVHIAHGWDSYDSSFYIDGFTFTRNKAEFSGGAIDYYTEKYPYENNNKFVLGSSRGSMDSNVARNGFGGGMNHRKLRRTGTRPLVFNQSCVKTFVRSFSEIQNNNAKLGSAFFFDDAYVEFKGNTNIYSNGNSGLPEGYQNYGAVYGHKTHIVVKDKLYVYQNNFTGIVLDDSVLYVTGTGVLTLENNHGIKGGGMALYEQSKIHLNGTDSKLFIIGNLANRGAGLYVHFTSPFLDLLNLGFLQIYECFFVLEKGKKKQIFFNGNKAEDNEGNDIFSTSLKPCGEFIYTLSL